MRVNEDLRVLKLPMSFGGVLRELNLGLIGNKAEGLTLIDTGLPGQDGAIEAELREMGFELGDLKRIIITHQDIDHIGSLHALKERTNATVYAYSVEVPYIDGEKPLVKSPTPERLAANPEFAAMWKVFSTTKVDQLLSDGEVLDISGGVRVIATPGHTPGHASLYLERTKTLITGDALTSDNGRLNGPNEGATPDLKSALQSVAKLAELDVEAILCYHGGLVTDNANEQLRQVAGALTTADA